IELRGVAGDARNLLEGSFELRPRDLDVAARALDESGRHALVVVEEDLEQMERRELLVPLPQCKGLGALDETAGPLGVFLDVHSTLLVWHAGSPRRREPNARSVDMSHARIWRRA